MIDVNTLRLLIEETINEELLTEGGAGGHMRHPFDLDDVKTGEELIEKIGRHLMRFEQKDDGVITIGDIDDHERNLPRS